MKARLHPPLAMQKAIDAYAEAKIQGIQSRAQEQAKDLATFAREHELYNWASIVALVDCAIENGDFVVINEDW